MAKFESKDGKLFIDGKEVVKAWESFNGFYWFAVKKVREQVSLFDGREVPDTIWYGYVQMLRGCEEWGDFSQAEIENVGKFRVWEIPKENLPWSGRRS